MIVVLDASVVLKWLLEDPIQEPDTAVSDTELLAAMEFPTTDNPRVIQRATRIAVETRQHVFDALYHAVAPKHDDAMLVSADDRYYERANGYGRIQPLCQWRL